jgi:DMSO/TMAO reductase YedYZ heme-binding membrane subunit
LPRPKFQFSGNVVIAKRPFVTVGFTAFVLIPRMITSTAGWIRCLGGRRWQMLHRLIYQRRVWRDSLHC